MCAEGSCRWPWRWTTTRSWCGPSQSGTTATSRRAALILLPMPKSGPRRVHLRELGITSRTRTSYKKAMGAFFDYLDANDIPLPADLTELDPCSLTTSTTAGWKESRMGVQGISSAVSAGSTRPAGLQCRPLGSTSATGGDRLPPCEQHRCPPR